jgi:hypothetical protein
LRRIRTRITAIALAAMLPATIAACGGGSSSSTSTADPQQVLNETFSNSKSVNSGKLDLELSADVQGNQAGSFQASISGPFESGGNAGALPQFDLTGKLSGSAPGLPAISFEGGLVATKSAAYVEYQGTAYQVPSALFSEIKAAVAQAAQSQKGSQQGLGSALSQAGVKPIEWFSNLTDKGTATISGTDTDHVTGDVDVAKLVTDLRKLSALSGSISGQSQAISPRQLQQLQQSVKTARVDVYSGQDDHLLRKLAVSLDLAPPNGVQSSVSNISINFSLTLSDLNQPETISAPQNVKQIPRPVLRGLLQGLASGALSG